MRRLLILASLAACGGPAYQLTVRDSYEVGEDPTVAIRIRETTKDDAVLIITRPDGSTVRAKVPLSVTHNQIKFGGQPDARTEPTFTTRGDYRLELRGDNKTVLAQQEIRVTVDRLSQIFDDAEIAEYELATAYTRPRAHKQQRWKTYGALFEHTARKGVQIHVLIEEPGDALDAAWKPYKEEGTLGVIENNNVRFRERTASVSASWISGRRIIAMRAAVLADFERGFIAEFFTRYPSDL